MLSRAPSRAHLPRPFYPFAATPALLRLPLREKMLGSSLRRVRLPASTASRVLAPPCLLGSRAPSRQMGGGGGHDHTLEPPLYRLPLPNRALPEEDELIWNDRVAPETCLDLDAPHVSPMEGLLTWLGGFAFFYGVYLYAVSTSHPSNKPTVRDQEQRRGGGGEGRVFCAAAGGGSARHSAAQRVSNPGFVSTPS